jgi:hypothetical protein
MNDRTVRRTQTISPFGAGAVIDILGESFVAEDITRWRGRHELLQAPRIATWFGVEELRTPPSADERGSSLPYMRFPRWLFCGRCRRMTRWHWKMEKPGKPPRCTACTAESQLVPMRFVAVCGNGHLDDVDWVRWAHSSPRGRDERQCKLEELLFVHVPGVGGGLDSVAVKCACGARRDLEDLPGPNGLRRVGVSCRGLQPWQAGNEAQPCTEVPVAMQRGASSVYFPDVGSAIDIPPESNWRHWGGETARISNNNYFKLLLTEPDSPLADGLVGMVAQDEKVPAAQVRQVLADRLGRQPSPAPGQGAADDIRTREWLALTEPADTNDPRDNFISRPAAFPSPSGHSSLQPVAEVLDGLLRRVVLVDRLREIRALLGFRRHEMKSRVDADLGRRAGFLPAIEVFGEGVFLQLDEEVVTAWEQTREVRARTRLLRARLANSNHSRWLTEEVTPRLILLHTFAHLMLRQTAFDAGYSSSALRERIYSATENPAHAGVLIYTAAGDSEGTMGGLARLGQADRLLPIIASALSTAEWCSLDPVCGESTAQGTDGLSLAACHACALASETSCDFGNVLLDRRMLTDTGFGFFRDALTALRSTQQGPVI